MVAFGYLTLWFLGVLLAALLGFASHYHHAFLSAHPDKLVDGYRWRDHLFNETFSRNYSWWADYDEDGWWEFNSWKNITAYTVPPTVLALLAGAYFWADRALVVTRTCHLFANVGMQPLFCT